ncbi:hypothetical protein SAMN05421640_0185 [Ekhidna lutea]|uniref:Uncharacterized protein n=1 Tax=Ekhidna lutea TaxID=447679 RepID=A0A239EJH6_EKHLU|nr:hypothetical protein [Ekhidna lutea]SNS44806.1 hypothetical protein SAMN05421640_0185 [Ekhidna lutea]
MNKFILICILCFFSCSVQKNSTDPFDKTLQEELGENFSRIPQGEYVLCRSDGKLSQHKTFLVYKKSSEEIIYGPIKLNGDINWASSTELLIKEYPEVIENKQGSSTYTYYYNLLTGKKYEKNNDRF